MEQVKKSLKAFRNVFLLGTFLLCLSNAASAHRVETFTTTGCTPGANVTVDAIIVAAGGNTWYAWQYKDATGIWKCFQASNTINGVTFTAQNYSSAGPANNAPTLTILNATSALDNVLIRVLMRDDASPCGAPAGTTYGGDDLALNEVKNLRLHIYTAVGDCGGTTPGCIGNIIQTGTLGTLYYGGFENRIYSVTNDNYTDLNFAAGAGSSDFTSGTTAGHYSVVNNPYSVNTAFVKNMAPHSGNFQMVVLGNSTASARAWYKTVTVVPGSSYHFSAWVARVDGTDPNIALRVNNAEINNSNIATVAAGNWVQVSATYIVPAGTTSITISIGDKNAGGGANNYSIDDICFRLLGSIGDIVFNDVNKDGIRNNGEVGIAGVSVSLLDANGKIISSTITDALGTYLFNGLSTSASGVSYSVDFGLPAGYQFTAKGATLTTDNNSDADIITGKTGTVTLTSALPNVTYVDAGAYYTAETKIGDRVWNDLDKNGIQDAGEPGIAGVSVMLYKSDNTFVGATVTDNNGNYSFSDLPAASYYLRVTPPAGYVLSARNTTGNSGTATDSDFGIADFKSSTFTTTATTLNLDWDAGMYLSSARSVIGDRVWNDLNGDNLQTAGEPGVANVTVQLYNKSTNTLLQTTATDAFGYYYFNGLGAGSYYVKFTLPAGFTFVTAKAGSDDNVDSDVSGANGTGTTASFALIVNQIHLFYDAGIRSTTANLTSLGDFVWYDINKDGLQTAGEPGMPGITVKLYSTANVLLQTTSTDNSGFYKFTGLTVGTQYVVGFSNVPAGYTFTAAKAGADNIDSDVQPTTGRTAAVTATAQSAAVTTVDAGIILAPSVFPSKGSIGDFVWNDINNNGVQDAGEPGISGVTVKLYDGTTTTVLATTTTDALGRYIFTNLPAGNYTVEFSGYPAEYVFSTPGAGTDKTKDSDPATTTGKTAVFSLAAGEINITVDAGMRNPAALSSIGNQVWNDLNGNGVFDAATESGISGVSVYLYDENQNLLANTVTNEGGFYLFTGLKADTYSLGFGNIPAGFAATTRTAAAAADNDSDPNTVSFVTNQFTLAGSTTDLKWDLGLRSTTYGSIGDKVWNDLDRDGVQDAGEPGVPGILVTLYNSAGTAIASTVTDGTGYYIFKNVIAGSYSVGFSTLPGKSGFTTKSSASGTTATDSDADLATGKTAVFTLTGGQNKTDIDAGLISLFASIGDFVWRDANSDGLQTAGEKAYPGMTLTLYNAATNTPITSAVADGKGFYFINNIPVAAAGSSFYVVFTGLLPNSLMTTKYKNGTTLATANNNDFGTVSGVIRTDAFTLLPGENNPNIDAGVIAPDDIVVAISGLELAATLNNNVTELKWYTNAEVNNDHFEIERSIDGINYAAVGTKAAAGYATSRTDYTSNDPIGTLASKAVIYYRIKSYGTDGNFVYSNVVMVRPGKSASIEVWPNPFAEQLNIKVTSAARSQATVVVTDSKGMTVKKSTITLSTGANFINYTDLASLAKGAYTIRIVQDNETLISQVVVKN